MNNFLGRVQPVFEWIINLATLNLTWLVFILPIAYLSLLLVLVEDFSQMILLLISIIVLSPVLLFPATTALFGVVRKWFMKEDIKIIRSFWKYYKENYKRSFLGGLFISFLWLIGSVDYLYFKNTSPFINFLFLFILALLLLYTLYFFSDTVHTESKLSQSLKNVLIISITNPVFSFGIIILCIFIIYISFTYFPFLLLLFTGVFVAILSYYGYHKIFTTITRMNNK